MKFKRLIKKILDYNPTYDLFFPEHKAVGLKLQEMKKENPEQYILDIIERGRKDIIEKYRLCSTPKIDSIDLDEVMDAINDKKYTWFEVIYWWVDFDITEEYIWHRASTSIDNFSKSPSFKAIANL